MGVLRERLSLRLPSVEITSNKGTVMKELIPILAGGDSSNLYHGDSSLSSLLDRVYRGNGGGGSSRTPLVQTWELECRHREEEGSCLPRCFHSEGPRPRGSCLMGTFCLLLLI